MSINPQHPVVITAELIEAGATAGVGYTRAQIRLLEGKGRPKRDWKSRAIGRPMPYAIAKAFLFDARRIKHRPKPGSPEQQRALAVLERAAEIAIENNPMANADASPASLHVEITSEMIAAGAAELDALPLTDLAEGWFSKEDAAAAIYLAMRRAALEPCS